ncbi:MAG: hypothetical protein KKH94_01245, partial [Candidatus Omnitrophica bacterium]|nr:hypothetical protein [Candidatus Omnitrophota bacterium]
NQHKTIVEVTSLLMGDKASTIVVHFEEVRQKQHALVHNHSNLISELEAHDAFHYALLLVREITKLIKKKDPDFHVSA